MKGSEFLKRIEKLGVLTGQRVIFEPDHGKGSHGRLNFGARFTTLKDLKKEIGRDLLSKMCRDLGVRPHDLL